MKIKTGIQNLGRVCFVLLALQSCLLLEGESTSVNPNPIQPVFDYYSNGQIKLQGQFHRGLHHGTWIEWNGVGDTLSILNYRDGILNGAFTVWKLNQKYQTDEDAMFDYAKDVGEVVKTVGIYSNGALEGKWSVYYSSGELKTRGKYSKGRMDGKWVVVDCKGDTSHIVNYSIGERKGPFTIWNYKMSTVKNEASVSAEKIKHQGIFKYNILNGNYVESYPSGNVKCSGAYIEGKREGDWTWYYKTGVIKEIAVFKYGELISSKQFNEEGY